MSNIINHNFSDFNLKLNNDEYYDYFLNSDCTSFLNYGENKDNVLISYIDINEENNQNDDIIYSLGSYEWENSFNNGNVLKNIGYTGVDNGLIEFKRDRVSNNKFLDIYTKSTYDLGDSKKLKLSKINGANNKFDYPLEITEDGIKLNGGFYQGFFKTKCDEYQVLPSNFDVGDVITLEFVLKKEDFEKQSNKTLNDKYLDNKGIFFYIGTRSENKWYLLYSNKDYICDKNGFNDYVYFDECDKSGFMDDYIEDDVDINADNLKTSNDINIIDNKIKYFDTDNKFIFFDRTLDGFNIKNWDDGDKIRFTYTDLDNNENLFLLMDRTNNGFTIKNIDDHRKAIKKEYDVYADIINNALCFRITDDGEIGYRYIVGDCESKINVLEGYSNKNVITEQKWSVIHVKIKFNSETMILYFYVDGKLIYITEELPKLNLRELNDLYEKQEGVPYNISLGGGTQGLCDVVMPNYMDDVNIVLPIEKYFAGSFIGYLKSFKWYNGNIDIINLNKK